MLLVAGGVGLYLYLNGLHVISPLPVRVGDKIVLSASSQDEAQLRRLLKKYGIVYTDVASAQDGYVISLSPKQQVFLTKKKDLASQVSSLQVILPRLTMEGKQFSRLDLRYDKPIVVY